MNNSRISTFKKLALILFLMVALSASKCPPDELDAPGPRTTRSGMGEGLRAQDEQGPVYKITESQSGEDSFPALSRDGESIFFSSTNHYAKAKIYHKPVTGRLVTQITRSPGADYFPAPSPDGKTLAFLSNRSGRWDIYLLPVPRGNSKPVALVANSRTAKTHPSWSPDGKRIVFSELNASSGRWELAVYSFSDNAVSYPREGMNALYPEWCPINGSETILFQRAPEKGQGNFALWLVEADGSKLVRLLESDQYACVNPAWSPDGKVIAYATVSKSQWSFNDWIQADDIWVVGADGKGNRQVTYHEAPDWSPTWSPDGSRIFFVSTRGGRQNVFSIPYAP